MVGHPGGDPSFGNERKRPGNKIHANIKTKSKNK
jgi:hypothetical protein